MINEHKFYNEYIKPVLDEIKEELNKRGVDCRIVGRQLHKNEDLLVSYDLEMCQFYVDKTIQHLFSNDFACTFNTTTELIFAPIKTKSIYDICIGDTVYYVNSINECSKVLIDNERVLNFYKKFLEYGNAFLTQEECEKRITKNKAIAKIKRRAYELQGDWKPDWKDFDNKKVYIKYDHSAELFIVTGAYWNQGNEIFFKTERVAQQIIHELPEECKLMLEVE